MKTGVKYLTKKFATDNEKKTVACTITFALEFDKIQGFNELALMKSTCKSIDAFLEKYNGRYVSMEDEDFNAEICGGDYFEFTTNGVAKCAPADEFDKELGRKIALTRAQAEAFKTTALFYQTAIDSVDTLLTDIFRLRNSSAYAAFTCINHSLDLAGQNVEFETDETDEANY